MIYGVVPAPTVVTVGNEVAVQPVIGSSTVTVIDSAVLTVIVWFADPVLQVLLLALLEVKSTVAPLHNDNEPLAVIVGTGTEFTVTAITFDVPEQPLASVTVVE
jgi:hypothetical protein